VSTLPSMKLLLVNGTDHFLVDLEATKALSLREVIVQAGDDELVVADLTQLDRLNLDAILAKALAPKTAEPTKGTRATKPAGTGSDAAKIREWAKSQGIEVKAQGAVPKDVRDKYEAAQK